MKRTYLHFLPLDLGGPKTPTNSGVGHTIGSSIQSPVGLTLKRELIADTDWMINCTYG